MSTKLKLNYSYKLLVYINALFSKFSFVLIILLLIKYSDLSRINSSGCDIFNNIMTRSVLSLTLFTTYCIINYYIIYY